MTSLPPGVTVDVLGAWRFDARAAAVELTAGAWRDAFTRASNIVRADPDRYTLTTQEIDDHEEPWQLQIAALGRDEAASLRRAGEALSGSESPDGDLVVTGLTAVRFYRQRAWHRAARVDAMNWMDARIEKYTEATVGPVYQSWTEVLVAQLPVPVGNVRANAIDKWMASEGLGPGHLLP